MAHADECQKVGWYDGTCASPSSEMKLWGTLELASSSTGPSIQGQSALGFQLRSPPLLLSAIVSVGG
jgi:hypothetical protein